MICNMLSGYEMGIAIIVTCCDSVYMHIYLIRLCTYAMWCGYNVNWTYFQATWSSLEVIETCYDATGMGTGCHSSMLGGHTDGVVCHSNMLRAQLNVTGCPSTCWEAMLMGLEVIVTLLGYHVDEIGGHSNMVVRPHEWAILTCWEVIWVGLYAISTCWETIWMVLYVWNMLRVHRKILGCQSTWCDTIIDGVEDLG